MDAREFRNALGHFPTGVAVVTASGAERIGMTMSSFNSVSLDPPLVLFSVDRRSHSLAAMERAEGYAVNVLGQHQEDLSRRFARALEDKWQDVEHRPGHAEAPVLDGVVAHFECVPYARHHGGDHVIFLARVVHFEAIGGAPLVFYRGSYRRLEAAIV